MKKFVFAITTLFMLLTADLGSASVHVKGYYRKNGTYVQPHYRSDPNGSTSDNWSSKGNVNPYTGAVGTRSPYEANGPSYSSPYTDSAEVEENREVDSEVGGEADDSDSN